jgi:fermentation-respiration switch protein FrsA (DUF1100 family)
MAPNLREDVEFNADGVKLRGWYFRGAGPVPAPLVVMAHGAGAVKEQYLDRYAEVFAAAGLGVLVYDHRNFGASEGQPRQEIDPIQQARDYRTAITFGRTLPDVDPGRIGIWGTSYSGGHVLMVAAIDRRVRCVVSQVPTISGSGNALRKTRPELLEASRKRFDADRAARFRGEAPATLPIVSQDANEPVFIPGREAWDFFQVTRAVAPHRKNEVTLRSVEMAREYEPGIHVSRISPTPLLMIVADRDTVTPTDLALDAYERALEPKSLVLLKGGHYDPYVKQFAVASTAARDWFVQHLGARDDGHLD